MFNTIKSAIFISSFLLLAQASESLGAELVPNQGAGQIVAECHFEPVCFPQSGSIHGPVPGYCVGGMDLEIIRTSDPETFLYAADFFGNGKPRLTEQKTFSKSLINSRPDT